MGNSIITATGLTREALRVLHNNLVFLKNVDKQYSKEFAVSGAKVGTTINIRYPNRYFVSHQTALQAQVTTEITGPLQLNTPFQVGLVFTQQDLTLSMDEFSKRTIQPAMARLAADMDMYALTMALDVYNQVGTPCTTPGPSGLTSTLLAYTAPQVFLNAGMMMDNFACPRDLERRALLNPAAMAGSVGGLSGLYQDQKLIAEQYRKGIMGHALGFEFAMDQNINTFTTGTRAFTDTNWQMDSASQTGSSITFTVETQAQTGLTIKKGERFTIAGLYSVNPENQQSTGQLAQFVFTADITMLGAGTSTVGYISPAIKYAGTGVADGTVTGSQADNAVMTMLSSSSATACTASQQIVQNLCYHKDAFTFATADLEKPQGVDFCAREVYDGISMLVVRDYDINSAQFPCRIDVLAGWKTLRPEFACVVAG